MYSDKTIIILYSYIYTYKEELKTVVRERARNQIATKPSQRFGAPTIECSRGGDVCKYASAEERAAKNQKTTVRLFGFMEKVCGLPCTATAAMPKRRTSLSRTTRDAKRKKASGARS